MDVQMPGVDGLEATRRIRQLEQRTGDHLPVIALTAHAMEEQREECLRSGMDSFLSKPIDREAMDELLDHFGKRVTEPDVGHRAADSGAGHEGAEMDGLPVSPPPETHCEGDASVPPREEENVFDLAQVMELVGGDEELLRDIVSMFLEDSTRLLGRIRSGLDAGDPKTVERAAHQLRGSSANLRAREVSDSAFQMEQLAGRGSLEAASRRYPGLERALLRLQAAIKKLR
jgi:CheY-like chemotaxis protein